MIRRALPHVAVLVLLAGLAWLTLHTLRVLGRSHSRLEAKVRGAERVLAYEVTDDSGPRFLLDGGAMRVRLSSSAITQSGTYDPSQQVTYALRLIVSSDGKELWRSEVAATSRQSKQDWNGTTWLAEGAWSVDGVQLCDERVSIVDLPAFPIDSLLELRATSKDPVLVRAFVQEERDLAARERAELRWDDGEHAELLQSSTYVPWALLGDLEKQQRVARRWKRMSAVGEEGTDFNARAIFLSDFRLPQFAVDVDGVDVSSDVAAVVNVRGPTKLRLAPIGRPQPFRVDWGVPTRATWQSSGEPIEVEVGAGLSSVVVSTDQQASQLVEIRGSHDAWIAPVERKLATPAGRITPTRVRIPMVVIGPNRAATFTVAGSAGFGSALRIDARLLGDGDATRIKVDFFAEDGALVGSESSSVAAARSRFDRYVLAGTSAPVSLPVSLRVLSPAGVTSFSVSADSDLGIVASRWLPGAFARQPPYDEPLTDPDSEWRYAPLRLRNWFSLVPENYDELLLGRRVAQLEAQVRVEQRGSDDSAPDGGRAIGKDVAPLYEVVPLPGVERQVGREVVRPTSQARLVRTWGAGAMTELKANTARMIDFRSALASRPRLLWIATRDMLGKSVTVRVGDKAFAISIGTTSGGAALDGIAPGHHRVVAEASGSIELWISRPPVGNSGGLYRDRTLYRVGKRPVGLNVRLGPGEQLHLYAIFYSPEAEPQPRVAITVDRGRPRRRVGISQRITIAQTRTELPPSRGYAARLVNLGGRWAGMPRVVHVGLLDDLAPGQHLVEVAVESGPPLWVRLIATRTQLSLDDPDD